MLEHIIIIIPYVRSLRNTLDVDSNRWTLLILDVFKEKMNLPGERITEKKIFFWKSYQQTRPTIFQSLDI